MAGEGRSVEGGEVHLNSRTLMALRKESEHFLLALSYLKPRKASMYPCARESVCVPECLCVSVAKV